ncbi:hypothetical protein sr10610.2 [Sporisorium reilianum SRZ2]|uniref:CCHC-type domain-containing protein n=1 Tax=Sporisorium reilianum (strain SRZ2) TaxID=999809 RepID=E6ZY13_SPORE|nr:hypothetical protein sr10610.2 [Sporisorium reilianum SRZ2]
MALYCKPAKLHHEVVMPRHSLGRTNQSRLSISTDEIAAMDSREPSTVPLKRSSSPIPAPDPWGTIESEKRRKRSGMGSESNRSSDGLGKGKDGRVPGAFRDWRERSTTPTSSSVSAPTSHSSNRAWQELEALSYTTFARPYNKLIWTRLGVELPSLQPLVPNSRRWRFNGVVLGSLERMESIRRTIADHLRVDVDISRADLTITFPCDEQGQYVEVYFSTFKAFRAAASADLRWDCESLELVRTARPIARRQTIITIYRVNPRRAKDFWYKIRRELETKVEFVHLWARRKEHKWTGGREPPMALKPKKAPEHGITLIGLAEFKAGKTESDLPGYVRDDYEEEFVVHFEGRGQRCTLCRSNARRAHTKDECRAKKCSRCGTNGHLPRECRVALGEGHDLDL